jgi:hypothetical protein
MPIPEDLRRIMWIVSYPRSGNTWTRLFLNRLSRILSGQAVSPDLNDINELGGWEISSPLYAEMLGKPVTSATWQEIVAVRPRVQSQIAARARSRLFLKTHLALLIVANAPSINLDVTAGAIYVVRNPLDVAVSLAPHYGVTIDEAIEFMAKSDYHSMASEAGVSEMIGSWSRNVSTWTKKRERIILVVRYEDMLAKPLVTFASIARHAGFRPTPKQLRQAIELSSFQRLRLQEEQDGFPERSRRATDRFFRAGAVGGWKTHLTDDQVARIIGAHKSEMKRFGYLPEAYPDTIAAGSPA